MQNSASGQLNPDPKEDAPWYVKYGVKALATTGGGRKFIVIWRFYSSYLWNIHLRKYYV